MAKNPKMVLAHVDDGRQQAVLAELRVLVAPSALGGYVAQGLEIDYVACGDTEEEARTRFSRGFVATVRKFISRQRPLDGLFKTSAPAEARRAYFAATTQHVFRCAVFQGLEEIPADIGVPRSLAFVSSPLTLPQ